MWYYIDHVSYDIIIGLWYRIVPLQEKVTCDVVLTMHPMISYLDLYMIVPLHEKVTYDIELTMYLMIF